MRQLLFDEIREGDVKKIKRYLHKKATPSPLGEIFPTKIIPGFT